MWPYFLFFSIFMPFSDFPLRSELLASLTEAGFAEPTRVQAEVMPDILE